MSVPTNYGSAETMVKSISLLEHGIGLRFSMARLVFGRKGHVWRIKATLAKRFSVGVYQDIFFKARGLTSCSGRNGRPVNFSAQEFCAGSGKDHKPCELDMEKHVILSHHLLTAGPVNLPRIGPLAVEHESV